jgi:hypothetical protein
MFSDCALVAEPAADYILTITAAAGNRGIGDLKTPA